MNLHGGRDRDGREHGILDTLAHLSADVIALQEAWRPHQGDDALAAAADALGLRLIRHDLLAATTRHDLGIPGPSPHTTGAWGLATLTALPVLGHTVLDLGQAPGDMARRAAQVVTVAIDDGAPLRVVNTHLSYRLRFSPGQLRRLARELPPKPHPTVICGDLNTVWPLTLLAPGYRRAARVLTWPAHRPIAQIDHLLIDERLLASSGEAPNVAGSDHLPVRAVLSHTNP